MILPEISQKTELDLRLEIAQNFGLSTFTLGNRRYLGSKSKLLPQIELKVREVLGRNPLSLMDAFAGSGVVSTHFASLGTKVLANDLLLHNAVAIETFLNNSKYDYEAACETICEMAALAPVSGYITECFGGKYFSIENAMKLDAGREFIANNIADEFLAKAALTSLLYAADKVAQTVGHYDAFFNRHPVERPVEFRVPLVEDFDSTHQVFNLDANVLVLEQSAEVLYLDPPYNSRQYCDAYHVLENITLWQKPEVHGVSRKMDRKSMKSKFSSKAAFAAFSELINSSSADIIVLSYSNTGSSRVTRSNNILTDEEIMNTLQSSGKVTVEDIEFKEFSVGKTSNRDHKERLFVCEIGR